VNAGLPDSSALMMPLRRSAMTPPASAAAMGGPKACGTAAF
jgi:hypothetical protein